MAATTASPQTKDLSVLITGGAGGLGKAIAHAFLSAGSTVSICDVNASRLTSTREEFQSLFPDGKIFAYETDITSESAVSSLFSTLTGSEGPGSLDLLINNAGIMDYFDPVGTLDKSIWDRVLGVNLTGSWLMMKYAVRVFDEHNGKKGGSIIQIGSTAAVGGNMESGVAYTVSKHGVKALVENTASFYAHRKDEGKGKIYATGLMCGPMIGTNISEGTPGMQEKMNLEFFSMTPGGRFQAKVMEAQAKGGEELAKIPGLVDEFSLRLDDVARYCVFLSDRSVAASSNGKCIAFSKDPPAP